MCQTVRINTSGEGAGKMSRFIDLAGQKFSMLRVIARSRKKSQKTMWICECDCGEVTVVRSSHLRNGHSRTCGLIECIEKLKLLRVEKKEKISDPNISLLRSMLKYVFLVQPLN